MTKKISRCKFDCRDIHILGTHTAAEAANGFRIIVTQIIDMLHQGETWLHGVAAMRTIS